jgi:hypothetical protein
MEKRLLIAEIDSSDPFFGGFWMATSTPALS